MLSKSQDGPITYPYKDVDDVALVIRLISEAYQLLDPLDEDTRVALSRRDLLGQHFTFRLNKPSVGIAVGDVVKLKSGGPRATVQVIYGEGDSIPGYSMIAWFEGNKLITVNVITASLERVE